MSNVHNVFDGTKVTPAQLESMELHQGKDGHPIKVFAEFIYETCVANGIRECVWIGRIPETGRCVVFTPAGQTAESTFLACQEGAYRMQNILWGRRMMDPAAMYESLEDEVYELENKEDDVSESDLMKAIDEFQREFLSEIKSSADTHSGNTEE